MYAIGLYLRLIGARVRAQMSIDEKRGLADVVIDNTGGWEQTEQAIRELFAAWSRATG